MEPAWYEHPAAWIALGALAAVLVASLLYAWADRATRWFKDGIQ